MRADWRVSQLEQEKVDVSAQLAALRAKEADLSSPARVRMRAEKLGMTPVKQEYLVLSGAGLLAQADTIKESSP